MFMFILFFAQSAGAVEYTNCISAEGVTPSLQRVSWNDIKKSDGEVLVLMELWEMWSTASLPSLLGSLRPRSGSTW